MRGEYSYLLILTYWPAELPPRARRIRPQNAMEHDILGTTSACAENTGTPAFGKPSTRNYLRVRGEYWMRRFPLSRTRELPPRARRIQLWIISRLGSEGTTSACAENTCGGSVRSKWRRNYLRVRGEYTQNFAFLATPPELPPRARRILRSKLSVRLSYGTTSACAENTKRRAFHPTHPRNYLRVRGEYTTVSPPACTRSELPPRARRIPGRLVWCANTPGTTSACAENTGLSCVGLLSCGNYLRVRGEYRYTAGRQ